MSPDKSPEGPAMNILWWLLGGLAIVAIVLGLWLQRRPSAGRIDARPSGEVAPTRVVLPDEGPEDRPKGGRTGENQELRRKIVHGPYRPIDDRGAPSDVRTPRQP